MSASTWIRLYVISALIVAFINKAEANGYPYSIVANDTLLSNLITEANTLKEQKDYSNALSIYNQALDLALAKSKESDASSIYRNIGYIYQKQKNLKTAKSYYKKSVNVDSLSKSAADSNFNLALIFHKEKITDSLFISLYRSLAIYKALPDTSNKFKTYSKASILFKNYGYYNQSIKYALEAYKGFEQLNNKKELAKVANTIGATQRLLGNLDIAKTYYKEGLKLREGIGDSLKLSFGYNNLGNLYKELKQYDSSSFAYKKAISLQKNKDTTDNLGRFYYNLGVVHYLKNEYNQAQSQYLKSIPVLQKENDVTFLSTPYAELASISIEQQEFQQAKNYLVQAEKYSLETKESESQLRLLEVQSKYYQAIGKPQKALDYNQIYLAKYRETFDKEQVEQIQFLQEQFENEKKVKTIKDLSQGNATQKEIISKQETTIQKKNRIILLAFILMLLAIVVYMFIRQHYKTKEKSLEIHRLDSIFKAQEVIKEQISHDLHDIVTTSFDAIRLKILALPKATNKKKVSEAIDKDIASVNNQVRLISHRLSPLQHKVKEATLIDIIIDQLSEFQFYRKIFVKIQHPLPSELNRFSLDAQTNIYGILLEVLHNVEKHSKGTIFALSHKVNKENLLLTFSDNGIGFNKDSDKGIGLLNIRQRAKLLRGEISIISSNEGTDITLSVPLKL